MLSINGKGGKTENKIGVLDGWMGQRLGWVWFTGALRRCHMVWGEKYFYGWLVGRSVSKQMG